MTKRIVCWFSCGAASAVATKRAIREAGHLWPDRGVVVAYCASTLSTEHPDNERFLADCEAWFGVPITMLYAPKYKDTWDVYERTGYLVGPRGARCTLELKKRARQEFERPFEDIQVFGFDSTEERRAKRFEENNPEALPWFPLIEGAIGKEDCLEILADAGIEIPAMYRLGYRNNNCIGCVKASSRSYWAKIREDFPDVFDRMAKLERKMDVAICKTEPKDPETGKRQRIRVFLDELDNYPSGRPYEALTAEDISCGVLCVQPGDET